MKNEKLRFIHFYHHCALSIVNCALMTDFLHILSSEVLHKMKDFCTGLAIGAAIGLLLMHNKNTKQVVEKGAKKLKDIVD